jgi:hypothetical protein
MKNNMFFKPEIPPTSLAGIGATSKNRRKSHGLIDRHPILLGTLTFAALILAFWWADCKINPAAHSQSLLQGLHQLFQH